MSNPVDETPLGLESPGVRERFARLAIDLSPLREHAPFRWFWLGQAVKDLGGGVVAVALPFQIYKLTGSTLAVAALSFVELVPLVSLTLVGGALADAVDRRRLMIWTQLGMAVVGVGLLVNAAIPHPSVAAVFVLGFFAASFFCLGIGGMRSVTPRLVPKDKIVAASVLESISGSFASVAGPAFGGVLIGTAGLTTTYAFDLATFVVGIASIVALPYISPVADAERPSVRSVIEGFRYVRNQPVVLGFMLVDVNAMIFGMPMALFPAIATHRYGNPSLVGYLYAAPYAGALVSSLSSGWIQHVRRQGLAVAIAASAWGIAIAAFGFSRGLWVGLVLLAAAGAADNVSAVMRSTIMLSATPEALRGRLTGIEFMQVASAPTLGNVEAGVVASLTSVRFSIASGGIACVFGTFLVALAFPALLRYDAKRDKLT
ncbi:MAG: MFS transporter [Gaiellaceae bacterium]